MFLIVLGLMAFVCGVSVGCGATPIPVSESTGDPPGSDAAAQDPNYYHRPTLVTDYDDSWVENIPDVIGGYEVLYVNTPKNTVCNGTPVIGLRARQKSMDEFLRAPPQVKM